MNHIHYKEIADRFNLPYRTAFNWSKDKKSWRGKLYSHLQNVYIKELALKVEEINDGYVL